MDIAKLVSRTKAFLTSPPSDTAIQDAIIATFAMMASRGDFYFMRAVDPSGPHSFSDGVYEYDKSISGCEKILSIGVKADGETAYTDIEFAEPDVFRRIKAGTISPGGQWWTIAAMVSADKYRLHFTPTPEAGAGVFQINYQMRADGASIARMPDRWIRCLTAGVLAELNGDANQEVRFENMLAALPARERIVTAHRPPYEVNEYDGQRNVENLELG